MWVMKIQALKQPKALLIFKVAYNLYITFISTTMETVILTPIKALFYVSKLLIKDLFMPTKDN